MLIFYIYGYFYLYGYPKEFQGYGEFVFLISVGVTRLFPQRVIANHTHMHNLCPFLSASSPALNVPPFIVFASVMNNVSALLFSPYE